MTEKLSEERDKYLAEYHRVSIEERRDVDRASLELGRHYDTWFMTIGGGALLLSVAFMEKIVRHPAPGSLWLLAIGWILLIVALALQLVSISKSQTALNQKILSLDYEFRKTEADLRNFPAADLIEPESSARYVRWARRSNVVALGALSLGLLCVCVFSCYNLYVLSEKHQERAMTRKPTNESRGTYVPSPNAPKPPMPSSLIQPTPTTPSPPPTAPATPTPAAQSN